MYSLPILELLQDCEDPPATPESLEKLQIDIGVRFPAEYRDFLLQFNGGNFKRPVMFHLPSPTEWYDEIPVNRFDGDRGYNEGCNVPQEGLAFSAYVLAGRIPDECLAIANTGGMGDVVLTVRTGELPLGSVWYWAGADPDDEHYIHRVADSFGEFLSMLQRNLASDDNEDRENIPIFLAIEYGNLRAAERFLSEGGDVETRNGDGKTLLAAAARYSWPKIVRLLLQHAADPNARDHQGRTPLHHAATNSIDSLKLLLVAGSDATARDREGKSVLAEWSYRAIKFCGLTGRSRSGMQSLPTALSYEATMYSLPILELLQDSHDPPATAENLEQLEIELGVRLPPEYRDFLLQFNGGTFRRPVMFYLPNPTDWINEVGVDSFLGDPSDRGLSNSVTLFAQILEGRIPDDCLKIACCGTDSILLQVAGPEAEAGRVWFWDSVDEGEGNNIHWIADSFSAFLAMLQYDTGVDNEDRESIPVFTAIEYGNLRAVEQFLSEGGDVETRNGDGKTLLAAAARYSWPKIVRLLLQHAADPNARDHQGRTPLHHAATSSIDSLKLLLAAGADATARDRKGKSVLAEWSYRADQILRAHGAKE